MELYYGVFLLGWDIFVTASLIWLFGEGVRYGGETERIVKIQDVRLWILLDIRPLREMVTSWFTEGRALLQAAVTDGM